MHFASIEFIAEIYNIALAESVAKYIMQIVRQLCKEINIFSEVGTSGLGRQTK